MGAAKITTDHDEIRTWVEERGGSPAHVKRTGADEDDPGVLRIDFPGYSGEESLEPMGWDAWFRAFDEHGLAFLHQDETEGGEESRFNKLVSRETTGQAEKSDAATRRKRPSARRTRPS